MDWSQLNDVDDWNDLSKMMEDGGDSTAHGAKKDNELKGKKPAGQQKSKGGAGHGDRSAQNPSFDLDNIPVSGWSDMRQFDDDHDPDWFEEEEKRLASIYGGQFIKVKYTEQGRPGYFCELCLSEMNAKKSLEAHCEGMKHLKKKALWEKNNGGQRDNRSGEIRNAGWTNGPSRDRFSRDRSPHRTRERSKSPDYRGRGRGYAGPPPPKKIWGPRDQCVLPSGPTSRYAVQNPRDEFGRSRRDSPRDFYGEPSYHPSHESRDHPPHLGRDYGPPPGRNDRFERRLGGKCDPRGRYDDEPRDRCRAPNDRSDGHHSPLGNAHQSDKIREDDATPIASSLSKSEKLSGGATGLLLTKLSSCYIKDGEDADLALNVVCALTSSLREYNGKIGERKIADLLMEAELKLSTIKALKVGLTIFNKQHTPCSSAYVGEPSWRT